MPTHHILHAAADPTARPLVILVSGQHGDEAESVLLGQWLARGYAEIKGCGGKVGFNLACFHALNVWGLRNESRVMEDGRDSNRSHGGPTAPEMPWEAELWALAASARAVLILDLHAHHDPSAVLVSAGTEDAIRALFPSTPVVTRERPGTLAGAAVAAGYLAATVEAGKSAKACAAESHTICAKGEDYGAAADRIMGMIRAFADGSGPLRVEIA